MKPEDAKTAAECCNRFEICQKNSCPLDLNYPNLKNHPSDPGFKQKCIAKSIRKRIGKKWNLPNQGMTQREISGSKKWAELPDEVKQERIRKLKKISPLLLDLKKPQGNIPTSKSYAQNTHTNEIKIEKKGIVGSSGGIKNEPN